MKLKYEYKEGEACIERLKNKLSTVFLAIESSKSNEEIIKSAKKVLPDIRLLLEDISEVNSIQERLTREEKIHKTNEGDSTKGNEYYEFQNSTIKTGEEFFNRGEGLSNK